MNVIDAMTTIDTTNILFICGGAFPGLDDIIKERLKKRSTMGFNSHLKDEFDNDPDILSQVTTEDLRNFGMIPEFLGRLPVLVSLQGLTKELLMRILKEPKNAILKQYERLLALDEVKLVFEDDALEWIAERALEKDTGARALRAILEDFVMDICAAPGGKTTAAAEFAQQGHVLSMDIAEEKLELIEENVERLKLANVDIRCQDATEYMQEQEEKADVVIADLPCSGLGIMGRKNDIKYRVTEEQIESLVELQHTILQNACRYVKAGGTLLYSTCTITKEENTLQVERFLKEHPEYTLKEQRQFLQGIDACDGFYYAVLHKLGD